MSDIPDDTRLDEVKKFVDQILALSITGKGAELEFASAVLYLIEDGYEVDTAVEVVLEDMNL